MTGRRPFPQRGAAQLIYAIMNEPPEPPSVVQRGISPGLENVVLKALEKDPDLRYHSARELRVDLDRLVAPSVGGVAIPRRPRAATLAPNLALVAAALVAVLVMVWMFNPGGVRDRWGEGATGPINSLAVLPLANLSGDPQQEYFADGMTEQLSTCLAKISALRVIARVMTSDSS